MRTLAYRLAPGADLRAELERITRAEGLAAGCILTAVGSLSRARLRVPGAIGAESAYRRFEGPLEIVSLTGTLGRDGLHVHVAISGPDGACVGGHLAPGCVVHTTAELVIGESLGVAFRRAPDEQTGFSELVVEPRGAPDLSSQSLSPPCLVCFSGLPGVGKTTLARAVALSMGATVLRIDDIEQAIKCSLGHVEVGATGYAAAQAIAQANLKLGRCIVADCVNPVEQSRAAWRETAERAAARILEVEVTCSDREEHHRRLTGRKADIPGHLLPTWSDISRTGYEAWSTPVLVIDTTILSRLEAVEAVVHAVRKPT